ncbi:MAG: PEP-CTERM sorting domain-containing protein [Armatimonadetes bacterium]|nr:PEP-CTERM sorting domain-containing protein [Armatimonadota bacterium]
MKRKLTLASLVAAAAVSQAGINFNIDNPDMSVVKPTSGFVLVDFTGTITTSAGFAPTLDGGVELPSNGSALLTFDHFDAGLVAYLTAGVADSNYSGALFTFRVQSTDADGVYDLSSTSLGFSPFAEAVIHAKKNGVDASDNEFLSVKVLSVPEPACLALLALGASALLARRRRA